MENRKQVGSSSSSSSLDHLFGPKDSSSASSSSSGIFGSMFPPPSAVLESQRKQNLANQAGNGRYVTPGSNTRRSKGESSGISSKEVTSSIYQNEGADAEPCYFSSSIYYGGQENYSPRTTPNASAHVFKKDDNNDVDDANGGNSSSASRGNWWQGSLYY